MQLIELPYNQFRAAYHSLSPQQKYDIWQQKLAYEIARCKSIEEAEYVSVFSASFTSIVFSDTNERESFLIFCWDWMNEGMERFNWTLTDVGLITMTLYPSDKVNEYYMKEREAKNRSQKSLSDQNPPPDCDCKWGWWCDCDPDPCLAVIIECGFLNLELCDELCNE